jgi:hypothetical protein
MARYVNPVPTFNLAQHLSPTKFQLAKATLSKRDRPDILTAVVIFLTSRVMLPTQEALSKLMRCLRYLKGTSDLNLELSGSKGMVITSYYVDASYAVHPSDKTHTSAIISIGGGAVYSKSSKQKLIA